MSAAPESETFDAAWYAQAFPDVALTGLSPDTHYQKYGRLLGRAPNAEEAGDIVFEPRVEGRAAISLWSGVLEIGRFQAKEALFSASAPLVAYHQMLRLAPDVFGPELSAAPDLGACPQAAWLKGTRLTIAGEGQHLRLYQAPPETPGAPLLIGGADLGGDSGLIQADLLNPFMPLLLEYAAPDGLTQGYALLPFPSLLRGGLHHAEAAGWGLGRDPMADLWRLSRVYLTEMLSSKPPIIGSLQAETLDPRLAEVLGPVFDLRGDLSLKLGPDTLPTIAALVSRRIENVDPAPYLVAEAGSYRPLWSVALPSEAPLAPVHLTLRLTVPEPVEELATPHAVLQRGTVDTEVTVALRSSDPALAAQALGSLALQEGVHIGQVLLWIEPNTAEAEILELVQGLFPGRVQQIPTWDLDHLAAATTGAALLLLEEQTSLQEPATLAGLLELLEAHPRAGSIAPAILHEAVFRKGRRIQQGSAGLFPMGLSFTGAPRLTVAAPDVRGALPRQTFPVIANTHGLCLLRPEAITDTAEARKGAWDDVPQDLKLGLDLRQFGWVSLCSTMFHAHTSRAPLPRIDLDPIGLAYLSPADWSALLQEVTLVRELRG